MTSKRRGAKKSKTNVRRTTIQHPVSRILCGRSKSNHLILAGLDSDDVIKPVGSFIINPIVGTSLSTRKKRLEENMAQIARVLAEGKVKIVRNTKGYKSI